jgi:cytosine/adenosine deaminase-related metal-dependent hydrolase
MFEDSIAAHMLTIDENYLQFHQNHEPAANLSFSPTSNLFNGGCSTSSDRIADELMLGLPVSAPTIPVDTLTYYSPSMTTPVRLRITMPTRRSALYLRMASSWRTGLPFIQS